MSFPEGRFDQDVEFNGKEYRVSSRYEDRPDGDESRLIDVFDSEGLYGFIELEPDEGIESAEAYVKQPGEEGLNEVEPEYFEELYRNLAGFEESWDTELEVENPRDSAF